MKVRVRFFVTKCICSLFSFIDFEFYVQNFLPLWKLLPACISRFRIVETTHTSTKFLPTSQSWKLLVKRQFMDAFFFCLSCTYINVYLHLSPLVFFLYHFPYWHVPAPLPFSRYLLCIVDVSPYFKYHKLHLSHVFFWLYFLINMLVFLF